jgi:hypothetical protein
MLRNIRSPEDIVSIGEVEIFEILTIRDASADCLSILGHMKARIILPGGSLIWIGFTHTPALYIRTV